jgi:hypothetical protein
LELFATLDFEPRPNLFFIFYTERTDSFWTIPSVDVARFSVQNKTGAYIGRRAVSLPKRLNGVVAERFAGYKNDAGFELLRCYAIQSANK